MTRFRLWMAMLVLWLAILFNLERVHEPINIASFVYVLAGLLAAFILVALPLRTVTLSTLAVGSLAILIVLKVLLGYPLAGASLPLTITESIAVLITVALAHQIALRARHFEETAADVATARWLTRPASFDNGQATMYREIKRARRHNRPLSVVVIEPATESIKLSIDRLIQEVRQEMVRHYVEVRLMDTLKHEVEDFDLVNHCDGRFIVLLPETNGAQAEALAERVADRVQRELGFRLRTGKAAFPSDEVTLTGLVARAEAEMNPTFEAPQSFTSTSTAESVVSAS